MKVAVELCYTISAHGVIDLPEGKTWDDVKDHYAKWGKLFLQFEDDGEYVEYDVGDANYDSVDWKFPRQYSVFQVLPDSEGGEIEADYDNCLLEAIP